MQKRRISVWLALLATCVALVACFVMFGNSRESAFSISLVSHGRYSPTEAVFLATLTNRTHHSLSLESVEIEWKTGLGRIESIHGIFKSYETVKPGKSVRTLCCVPINAEQVRVAVTYDGSPFYWLAGKLRLERYPKMLGWLSNRRLIGAPSYRAHFSPWVANQNAANHRPTGQSDGSGELARDGTADRAFPAAVAGLEH